MSSIRDAAFLYSWNLVGQFSLHRARQRKKAGKVKKPRNQLQPGISWPSLKAEWRGWWSAKGPVLLFGAKFGVLLLLFYGVLALPPVEKALYFYLEANAW